MKDPLSDDQGVSVDRCERRGRAHDDGFTLVELLIVIVVLGILSGVVVVGVGRFRSDANAAACQADVTAVNAAADAYQAVTGNYPGAMSDLTAGQYLRSAPAAGSFAFDAAARTATRAPACGGTPVVASGTIAATTAGTVPAAITTAPAGTPGACAAVVAIDNSWPQGYQASITVTNTGSVTYSPWTFRWTVPAGVTLNNGWYATVSQTGRVMSAEAPSWSTTLAPGASWAVGFIADGPSSPAPSAVTVNGVGCR
jgi:prepilin-type N-terminal cleavage/methylation domain-containing protein